MTDLEPLRAQLAALGERLREARDENEQAHAAVAVILPAALEAGISKREFSRLTGAGRPWMDRVLAGGGGATPAT